MCVETDGLVARIIAARASKKNDDDDDDDDFAGGVSSSPSLSSEDVFFKASLYSLRNANERRVLLSRHTNGEKRGLVRGNAAERGTETRQRKLGSAVFHHRRAHRGDPLLRPERETQLESRRLGERRSEETIGRRRKVMTKEFQTNHHLLW